MSTENTPLGKIDCHGTTRSLPSAPGNTDQFVVAEIKPALHVRKSSLAIDDSSVLFGMIHGLLLHVADGVGDRGSGQRASTVAIDAATRYFVNSFDVRHEMNPIREQQMLDDLKQSLVDCREQLTREVAASERFESMATTLTMAYVMWPRAYIVHVGSNRAYLARQGALKQLTTDHTMAQKLQQAGVIGPSRAHISNLQNVLCNVVGSEGDCVPDTAAVDLEVGDMLLLCSDGVAQAISESDLLKAIQENDSASETCERILSSTAIGQDDATVVVAKFVDRDQALDTAAAASQVGAMTSGGKSTNLPTVGSANLATTRD